MHRTRRGAELLCPMKHILLLLWQEHAGNDIGVLSIYQSIGVLLLVCAAGEGEPVAIHSCRSPTCRTVSPRAGVPDPVARSRAYSSRRDHDN